MKILSFGASTSSKSINRQFARFAANQLPNAIITVLDLRDFPLPFYSSDQEECNGIPAGAKKFLDTIKAHDVIVVSLAEHNGSYSAAFKNLYDWASRHDNKVWAGKPMLLLSTSPGARGGATVLEAAKATFPRMGADLKASFSLPSFYENFDSSKGIKEGKLASDFQTAVAAVSS